MSRGETKETGYAPPGLRSQPTVLILLLIPLLAISGVGAHLVECAISRVCHQSRST